MPGRPFARLETGKLSTAHYHKRHVKSECWSCGVFTDLAFFVGITWEFYCPTCEVIWRDKPG
jgi:predicted RNA-binding Zn-ribbon protein involved in translation (DUF1610 family)